MSDSIRNVFRVALVAFGLAACSQAHAATASFDCPDGTLEWISSSNTLRCNVTPPPSGDTVPVGCSVTARIGSGTAGTSITGPSGSNVTLTANCTASTGAVNVAWGGSSLGGASCPTSFNVGSPATCTVNNVTTNSTWTASFSNGIGNAGNNPRSATFTVQAAGGGGSWGSCPSNAIKIDGQYGNDAINTADYNSFKDNILSIRISVPAGATDSGLKYSSWVEFGAASVLREAVLSNLPCEFGPVNAVLNGYGQALRMFNIRPSFNWRIGAASTTAGGLAPGGTYYLNIRNRKNSAGELSCGITNCSMRGNIPE